MSGGDGQTGGSQGWPNPGQQPQDQVPPAQQPYPQQPAYPQQQPAYPQQTPYPGQPQAPYPQGSYPQQQPPFPTPPQYPYPQQQPYAQQPHPQQPYQWPAMARPAGRSSARNSAGRAVLFTGIGLVVVAAVIAVAVFAGKSSTGGPATVAVVTTDSPGNADAGTAAGAQDSSAPSSPAQDVPRTCEPASSVTSEPIGYHACGTAARDVGVPLYNAAQAHRTYTITIKTNRGDIVFTADGSAAPYTVYSLVYLIQKKYYDDTVCHRLTTSGIYVLQCGDPTGTGAGGPGYAFQDENLDSLGAPDASGTVTYHAGVVAMANAGPDSNGSQFFLVYRNSPIAPGYTPFGTIIQGLDILRQVADAGTDDSNASGDGAPNETVRIESVTARQQ